jgi:hypothetical protein
LQLTDDLFLRNEQCKFILSFFSKLAQLYTFDLSANVRRQIRDLSVLQKTGKAGIGIFAMVVVFEKL